MTYTLLRGTDLLGRVEIRHTDEKALAGVLIPRDGTVSLTSETQMHLPAFNQVPASVFTIREEPEVVDAPPRPSRGGGSFALQPATDDMKVEPKDELRLLDDGQQIGASSVWLHEKRYRNDVPAEVQLSMPVGAFRGHSYWEVTVFLDNTKHGGPELDGRFDDVAGDADVDDISP